MLLRKKIGLMAVSVVLASMIVASPAQASHAKQCGERNGNDAEVRCCIKKAQSEADERRCIQRNT